MANEINITQDTGLTLTAKVYTVAGVQQGSTVNLTEVATGIYSGNFSLTGVSDGRYTVLFFNGTTAVGFGNLYVVDELEVDIHKLETKVQADTRQVLLAKEATVSALNNLSAGQVRTELATELGRIDVATSTRLATAGYTAPANSDITAIKAKTDNLPAIPASQGDITALNNLSLAQVEGSTVLAKEATSGAIKAKTDNLPSDPADQSLLIAAIDAVPTTGEIRAELATELAQITAIKAKTDNLPANTTTMLSTLQSSVNNIPTTPLLTADARLNNLDATISSRSTFDPSADPVINA